MTLWLFTRSNPVAFVLMSGVVFFGWGEIFSLFPSTLTDTTARSTRPPTTGSSTWPRGSGRCSADRSRRSSTTRSGSWMPVFAVIIAMNFATALLAGVALKPMRRRWLGAIGARVAAQRM